MFTASGERVAGIQRGIMQPSRSQRGLYELQQKQADRQAKEYAAATDRETLEVLKRSVDYLAGAGKPEPP